MESYKSLVVDLLTCCTAQKLIMKFHVTGHVQKYTGKILKNYYAFSIHCYTVIENFPKQQKFSET